MPHKLIKIKRVEDRGPTRPVMIAIAGDSAAGKTTLTAGLVTALGPERVTAICVDDYHRYDRVERRAQPFTALHPACNYVEIMEQHLQLLATGQPILKPVYDHGSGRLVRPELVEPREFVLVEGLLPLHTKLSRACFDLSIYLEPPEEIRHGWKVARDTEKRGYRPEAVLRELEAREPESAAYIRPQSALADVVVRFAPIAGRDDPPGTPLSAELVLRPSVQHPDLSRVLDNVERHAIHLKLTRDADGRPVDTLHVHGHARRDESSEVKKAIWAQLGMAAGDPPSTLGTFGAGQHSEPLAITQLLLLYHMLDATAEARMSS
ncbi:phosphoribulokinase [Amycolatopsis sp. SID8362]|uniref:phosphoribulokinase n=1 Tax=Amycolatopsis sp. SID8362 TaxID=2690346 RepID=UPI00136990D7|nr:phosphoribulokinase [Amycolatopsis sp. SID8362]NBH04439.1 phosphoribulokinase [Amycolatopsis sp. SID8362]NED41138.1 phosphoribulokinase [Amycolatopsis sp. SID8362]